MRSFVHRLHSSNIQNSITQNLVASLDQQLNWAMKSCFNRPKFDSSRNIKVQYRVSPIRYFLNFELFCYFWRLSQKAAFKTVSLSSFTLSENKRTRKLDCLVKLNFHSRKLSNKAWMQTLNLYQAKHPVSTSKYNYNTTKVNFKMFLRTVPWRQRDTYVYGKLSWKELRFNKNP